MTMLDPVKNLMRRHYLKKNASDVPTGITPLRDIHSAVAFIDVEDTSFHDCKNRILQFYLDHKMKGEIFFFDFRKLGEGERLITSGYLVEAPCWTSNGRYLTYSMEVAPGAKTQIAVTDITGYHTRIVKTKADAAYPAWSPTVGANGR